MNPRTPPTLASDLRWPIVTAPSPPTTGTVLLCCSLLRCDPEVLSKLKECLSVEEAHRAERFLTEELRHRFIVSRGVLRSVLGSCLGEAPEHLRFATGIHGKPRLTDHGAIEFNLTHTCDLMLLAVAQEMPVGVDVERMRRLTDSQAIARRFFTKREAEWLQNLDAATLERSFFRLWTRKEAILKATGEGIRTELDSFQLLDANQHFYNTVVRKFNKAEPTTWRLTELEPATGFVGAVAVPAAAGALEFHTVTVVPT